MIKLLIIFTLTIMSIFSKNLRNLTMLLANNILFVLHFL